MALNTIYNVIDSMVFEQIKDCERANEVWRRLEETYEGTPAVKSAKLYILKDKLTSFKMKDDESIPESIDCKWSSMIKGFGWEDQGWGRLSPVLDVFTSKEWDVEDAHHKRRIEGAYP